MQISAKTFMHKIYLIKFENIILASLGYFFIKLVLNNRLNSCFNRKFTKKLILRQRSRRRQRLRTMFLKMGFTFIVLS